MEKNKNSCPGYLYLLWIETVGSSCSQSMGRCGSVNVVLLLVRLVTYGER